MPVTLKLSRKFYETFGDQVANEFVDAFNQVDATYRSDLKELNESNFARFDSKLDARFAGFEERWAQFEAKTDARFAGFEVRWAQFEARMERRFSEQNRFMLLGWATVMAAIIATR